MRTATAIAVSALLAAAPAHAGNKSIYTKFNVAKCKLVQKPDGQVFEGSWRCKGMPGYDVFMSAVDAREMMSFGKTEANNCAGLKTFSGFNTAGDTIEWRFDGKRPIAAIQRWTVSYDPEDSTKHRTWLVVNKLENGMSCQMHYIAGSFPNANEAARKAADNAALFTCETGKPTFESAVGAPEINMEPCSAQARE